MQTRALKTLLKISELQSFAAAAEQLNMSGPAVSMQMKALEFELDAKLFDRTARPPRLTPLGRAICDQAAKILSAEQTLTTLCQPSQTLTGQFRIGFVATASARLLPNFLHQAREQLPQASFDIQTGLSRALEHKVASGQLDAAIVTASQKPPVGLRYKHLRREKLIFAMPAGHDTSSVYQLHQAVPFLHFMPSSGIGKLIAEHVQPLLNKAGRSIFLDSVEAIMECVKHDIGFTLLPEPDIHRHLDNRIRTTTQTETPLYRDLVIAVGKDTALAADLSLFSELFEQPETPQ
ncbi:LysR family transcriptional regulator [Roseovarius sp. EL26]|uniref:LysR family transcriptional regulator n=1 Tax=Roseovarius sp. EL26 TaxID=2126672 RepID=UPI000EA3881E|nr:LysR family transcriptional regulator [Roseovarius sp. EL26]